jgi:hypothetical protein
LSKMIAKYCGKKVPKERLIDTIIPYESDGEDDSGNQRYESQDIESDR